MNLHGCVHVQMRLCKCTSVSSPTPLCEYPRERVCLCVCVHARPSTNAHTRACRCVSARAPLRERTRARVCTCVSACACTHERVHPPRTRVCKRTHVRKRVADACSRALAWLRVCSCIYTYVHTRTCVCDLCVCGWGCTRVGVQPVSGAAVTLSEHSLKCSASRGWHLGTRVGHASRTQPVRPQR